MKSLIRLIFALLFMSAFLMAQNPFSRETAQSSVQSFAISDQGTLLELFDSNGKSRFGKISHDGFEVTYEIAGKKMVVSAIGTQANGLQRGEIRSDGQSAKVSLKTKDEALEITSYFLFDEKANELIISRKIRNVSSQPVTLVKMRDYVASTLTAGTVVGGIQLPKPGPGSDCYPAGTRKCLPPPCPWRTCPTYIKGRNYLTLEWKQTLDLAPSPQASHASKVALAMLENEVYIVVHVNLSLRQ